MCRGSCGRLAQVPRRFTKPSRSPRTGPVLARRLHHPGDEVCRLPVDFRQYPCVGIRSEGRPGGRCIRISSRGRWNTPRRAVEGPGTLAQGQPRPPRRVRWGYPARSRSGGTSRSGEVCRTAANVEHSTRGHVGDQHVEPPAPSHNCHSWVVAGCDEGPPAVGQRIQLMGLSGGHSCRSKRRCATVQARPVRACSGATQRARPSGAPGSATCSVSISAHSGSMSWYVTHRSRSW